MKQVRIGIIGLGGIACGKHIPELKKIQDCVITAACDIDPNRLTWAKENLGLDDAHCFTDYHDLLACPEVDAVEICTPNYLHVPMAVDAVKANKPINVEKPLSVDLPHAEPLRQALAENPVKNMMCFSYRFLPAVRYAKHLMEQGAIGDVINVEVAYLKSSAFWEGRRLDWRFVKEYAGTGVLGDLGVHLIDMAEFLLGPIKHINAATAKIVVKERQKLDSDDFAPVETDDYCAFMARMDKDIDASFVISRCAMGHANTIKYDIYGTKGVLSFDLNHPDEITVCVGEVDRETQSIHTVKVPGKYAFVQEQMFVDLLQDRECPHLPTVADGLHSQAVLDAVLAVAETGQGRDL